MKVDAARPYRSIGELTWPQLVMMVFQFFIGVADVYVCGLIGREAQAAMGMVSQALFFFLTVAIAVARQAELDGVAQTPLTDPVEQVFDRMWQPVYPELLYGDRAVAAEED